MDGDLAYPSDKIERAFAELADCSDLSLDDVRRDLEDAGFNVDAAIARVKRTARMASELATARRERDEARAEAERLRAELAEWQAAAAATLATVEAAVDES